MPRSDLRFIAIIVVMLLAGGLLRATAPGLAARNAAQPAQSAAAGNSAEARAPGAATPAEITLTGTYVPVETPPGLPPAGAEEVVQRFYSLIDRGNYEEAYQIAVENRWQKTADNTYRPDGLTTPEDFAKAVRSELVYDGFVIHLVTLDTLGVQPLTPDIQNALTRRELWVTAALPADMLVDGVYQVAVRGRVMSSCTAYDFFRRVTVAHLKGDGGWKVLLPGPLDPNGNHYEEWFKNTAS